MLALVASATVLLGQGRVNFNNVAPQVSPVTVLAGGLFGPPGQGATGDYVGAQYSVELLWAAGTFANYGTFFAANPSSSASIPFLGSTGAPPLHGPTVDGAGLFDGGIIQLGGPAGTYTMVARAWYNNGLYPTWQAAYDSYANEGISQLFSINATADPVAAPNTIFPSFTVQGFVPEPSTFALIILGFAGLIAFRRRK